LLVKEIELANETLTKKQKLIVLQSSITSKDY